MKYVILLLLSFSSIAHAQINIDLLHKAENYLNNIKTIKAEFTQIAPNGGLSTGRFYMQRPGLMRWQYHPPVPVLMVSRGNTLRFIDYELEQVSDIPLKNTIASLLAQQTINFSTDDIVVLRADSKDNVTMISAAQADAQDEGVVTFEFEEQPFKLRNIILKDAKGEETNISLSNAHYNVTLDPALFEMEDPRLQWRRKNRR